MNTNEQLHVSDRNGATATIWWQMSWSVTTHLLAWPSCQNGNLITATRTRSSFLLCAQACIHCIHYQTSQSNSWVDGDKICYVSFIKYSFETGNLSLTVILYSWPSEWHLVIWQEISQTGIFSKSISFSLSSVHHQYHLMHVRMPWLPTPLALTCESLSDKVATAIDIRLLSRQLTKTYFNAIHILCKYLIVYDMIWN